MKKAYENSFGVLIIDLFSLQHDDSFEKWKWISWFMDCKCWKLVVGIQLFMFLVSACVL